MIRFYLKLALPILLAIAAQMLLVPELRDGEVWYGLRCDFAYLTHDNQLLEQLLNEARDKQHAEFEQIVRRVNAGYPSGFSTD